VALHHYVSSILPYPDVFGFLVIMPSVFLPSCLLTSLSLNLRALTPLQALSPAIFHVTCFYSFPSVSHFFLSLLLRPFLFLSQYFLPLYHFLLYPLLSSLSRNSILLRFLPDVLCLRFPSSPFSSSSLILLSFHCFHPTHVSSFC